MWNVSLEGKSEMKQLLLAGVLAFGLAGVGLCQDEGQDSGDGQDQNGGDDGHSTVPEPTFFVTLGSMAVLTGSTLIVRRRIKKA